MVGNVSVKEEKVKKMRDIGKRSIAKGLCLIVFLSVWSSLGLFGPSAAQAQWRGLSKALRKTGKAAENVPFRQMDDFVPDAHIRRNAREVLMEKGKFLDEAAYARRMSDELGDLFRNADPATLQVVRKLDAPTQEMVFLASRGVRNVDEVPMDLLVRRELLNAADGKTLCALGLHPSLVPDAVNVQNLIRAGKITTPDGMRRLSLDDFGSFFHRYGTAGVRFWEKHIRPNWKIWVGGGALTALLLTPEEYLNDSAEWLADGAAKIAKFGVEVVSGIAAGTLEGTAEGFGETLSRFWNWCASFFLTWKGVGVLTVLAIVGLFIGRRTRRNGRTVPFGGNILSFWKRQKELGPDVE